MSPERWLQAGGRHPFHDKLWYLSKTPYSNEVFEQAAREVVMTVAGMRGAQKRLLLLDLDHTLWGGVLGEDGPDGLQLGGHDPIGEAYRDFQQELKRLKNRGVLLGIVSKNDEARALATIRDHPEMVLRAEDFVGWRIDWKDKAQNVEELVGDLKLRLGSVVVIDDSKFERARVREALPDVAVPEWPEDPLKFSSTLRRLGLFETASLTDEDQKRSQMYVAEQTRRTLKTQANSLAAWLAMLDMEVRIESLENGNLERATQLLNKTNQMNLSTRRMMAEAYREWEQGPDHEVLVFRLRDRFGDYGLCGLASIEKQGQVARLQDFLLSCRVIGRGAETAMLATMASRAFGDGCSELRVEFIPSPHNSPCLEWLRTQNWASVSGSVFTLTPTAMPMIPEHVRVLENEHKEADPAQLA
jgi:FkbH-like protein